MGRKEKIKVFQVALLMIYGLVCAWTLDTKAATLPMKMYLL